MKLLDARPYFRSLCLIGILLATALSSAWFTHFLENRSRPYWQRVFHSNKEGLTQFVVSVRAGENVPQQDGNFAVPLRLSKARILTIERKNGFLFFSLRPELPDDPIDVIAYDLDDQASTLGMRALLSLLSDRRIYHVQYLENGWFYCEYN